MVTPEVRAVGWLTDCKNALSSRRVSRIASRARVGGGNRYLCGKPPCCLFDGIHCSVEEFCMSYMLLLPVGVGVGPSPFFRVSRCCYNLAPRSPFCSAGYPRAPTSSRPGRQLPPQPGRQLSRAPHPPQVASCPGRRTFSRSPAAPTRAGRPRQAASRRCVSPAASGGAGAGGLTACRPSRSEPDRSH